MNTKQIIAELRRSACEDENPLWHCGFVAFDEACDWKTPREGALATARTDDLRTFYLLVAEAMEST